MVVVDGRPWLEGKELIRRLAKHGVECSYVLINALSFIMPEVSLLMMELILNANKFEYNFVIK